jgi:O-succinylbenzoic acid--CoA ligase
MTELSIRAAARDHGDRPALLTRDVALTFSQVAARLPASAERNIVATPCIDTVLAIYAALETRTPLALLHPRLPAAELARQRAELVSCRPPEDTAFVLFTSGSTSKPRGVAISRGAVIAAAEAHAARFGWQDDDCWLACLPLAHAGGLAIVTRCLVARRPIALHDGDFDALAVGRLARARRVTLASLVPALLAPLLEPLRGAPLRAVLLGGAPATSAQLAMAQHLPVHTTYGLTETFGQVATAPTPGDGPTALSGVELTAGTSDSPSRIRVGGPMLATRYLDGVPIAPELETADLGYLDARGVLHVCGREDDVIISGGENAHPAEIEVVLAATPGVRAACAFGLPDPSWGQVVGAVLVIDRSFDACAASERWRSDLPAHARPRRLAFVAALPLLASGKVDRRACAQLALSSEVQG